MSLTRYVDEKSMTISKFFDWLKAQVKSSKRRRFVMVFASRIMVMLGKEVGSEKCEFLMKKHGYGCGNVLRPAFLKIGWLLSIFVVVSWYHICFTCMTQACPV